MRSLLMLANKKNVTMVLILCHLLPSIQAVYGQTFQAPLAHRSTPVRRTAEPADPYASPLTNTELESKAQFYGALLEKLGTEKPVDTVGSNWGMLFLEHQAKKYEAYHGVPLHKSKPLSVKQDQTYFNEYDNRAALKEAKTLKVYIDKKMTTDGGPSRIFKSAKSAGSALKWVPDPTGKSVGTVISAGAEAGGKLEGFVGAVNDNYTEQQVTAASQRGKFSRAALLDPLTGLTRDDAVRISRRALSSPDFRGVMEEVGNVPPGFFEKSHDERNRLTDKYSLRVHTPTDTRPAAPGKRREIARKEQFSSFEGNYRLFTDDSGLLSMKKIEEKNRYLGNLISDISERIERGESPSEEKSEEGKEPSEKEKALEVLGHIQSGIEFAEVLVGDNKELQAGLAVGSAGVAFATALYMTPGIGQIAAIGTAIVALVKKIFSIFSSGEQASDKIIAMLEELQKKLEAFSNRMENRHQDLRLQMASFRLHMNQEFDAMKRLMRGEFSNLKERTQHIESLTRTSALITLHEGKSTQEYFRQLKQEGEGRLRDQLFRPTLHGKLLKEGEKLNPLDLVNDFQDSFRQVVQCAAVFSKAPINAGRDIFPDSYDRLVPKIRGGVLTDAEKSRIRGLFIPVRNGMSDVGILGAALKELNFNLNSRKYVNTSEFDGSLQTSLNEYQGPTNLFTWMDCSKLVVEVFQKAYGDDPEAETYRTLVETVDPDRKFQKLLMDSGYEILHSYQDLAPVDSEGHPSLQRVQTLVQNLHDAQANLAGAVDSDFKTKLLDKAHSLNGYDPRKPLTALEVPRVKKTSPAFVVSQGLIAACPGYVPTRDGDEQIKPAFAVTNSQLAELYSELIPKQVLVARDILGGEIKWCYRAIGSCPTDSRITLHEAEDEREGYDEKMIDVEVNGKICLEIEGAYVGENVGHHLFFKRTIEDSEQHFIGSSRYNPVYSFSPSDLTRGFDGGFKVPEGDSDRPLYDEAVAAANDVSPYRGKFLGFQFRGTGHRKDGIAPKINKMVVERWDTIQNGMLAGKGKDLLPKADLDETLKGIEAVTRSHMMQETMRYLEEDLKPDSKEKLGKVGKAIDQVETARALLISGLYFALGEDVHTRPELQSVIEQIPTGSGVVDNAILYSDNNQADEVVRRSMEPTRKLLEVLSDTKRSPIKKKWSGLEELLKDGLEPLYLARQAHAKVDGSKLRSEEIKAVDFVAREAVNPDTLALDKNMLHVLLTRGDVKDNVAGVNRLSNFLYLNAEKLKSLEKDDLNAILLELAGIYSNLALDPKGPRLTDEEMSPFLDKLLTRGILAQRPSSTNAGLMNLMFKNMVDPLIENQPREVARKNILDTLQTTGYLSAQTTMRDIDSKLAQMEKSVKDHERHVTAADQKIVVSLFNIRNLVIKSNEWQSGVVGIAPQCNNSNGAEAERSKVVRAAMEELFGDLYREQINFQNKLKDPKVSRKEVSSLVAPFQANLARKGAAISDLHAEMNRLIDASHHKLNQYKRDVEWANRPTNPR